MNRHDASTRYGTQYDPNNQQFLISGVMRPQIADELAPSLALLNEAIEHVRGVLYLDVKRLVQMNNTAFHAFARVILEACRSRPDLRFVIVTSSVVGWTTRKFGHLARIEPSVDVQEYDSDFYPGQGFLEGGGFIPILRTQTKLTWHHERTILPRHGMAHGIAIADICCGIGDFAVLVQKEFKPSRIVALDHSRPSLAYARKVAAEFDIRGIEYTYGDASEMLLEADQFDLVTCRHSLQIFNRPELILKELYRICKPGGRGLRRRSRRIVHGYQPRWGPAGIRRHHRRLGGRLCGGDGRKARRLRRIYRTLSSGFPGPHLRSTPS